MGLVPLIECVKDKPMDVVFLVDASGSVELAGLHSMHRFIMSVAMRLNLGTGDANDRVAVAHFSDSPTKTIGFEGGTSLPAIDAQLAKAQFGGATFLAKGLTFVRENILKSARDQDANTMLIVLTDGQTEDSSALPDAAAKIRNDGVLITAVNIANGDDDQLRIVVGGDADLVRKVEDFADLSTLVAQCTTTATTSTTTSTYTRSSSTATTTTSTTTTTNFKAPLPYRLMALCATALGLICTCMCMVISCSQHIAQRNKAYDAEDVEATFLPKE